MALQGMESLRTLNIRTMPPLDATKIPHLDNSHSYFAEHVTASLLDTQDYRPPLQTLAIGAFRYRDVRNGLGCLSIHEEETYEYFRPHIYDVDRRYRFEGRYKPLANLREVGTYEKTEAAGRCVEVLRPYWIG